MNLSKETKQTISLNYSISKNKEFINDFVKLHNEKTLKIMNRLLFLSNFNEEKINQLKELLEKVNYKLINNYFNYQVINLHSCQINFSCCKYINDIDIIVNNSNIIYFYEINKDLQNIPDYIKNFDFSPLIFNNEDIIKNDEEIINTVKDYNELKDKLYETLQTSFDNIYLLIKNIRTLDRIEKQFPVVTKYLPKEIKFNSENEDIKNKFNKL